MKKVRTKCCHACESATNDCRSTCRYDAVEKGDVRLSDIISGYIEPNIFTGEESAEKVVAPIVPPEEEEEETEGGGSEFLEEETGPDPEVARARFAELRQIYDETIAVEKKYGTQSKKWLQKREQLAKCFMDIKLAARQCNKLSRKMRSLLDEIRAQERYIMNLCVNKARMPRKIFKFFLEQTNLEWL